MTVKGTRQIIAACCPPLTGPPLSVAEATELAGMFKALADPVRLRLLSLIASRRGGEVCVCEMTGLFEVSGPTISHHLKVLRQAGLIDSQRRGTWVYYWLITSVLDRIGGMFVTVRDDSGTDDRSASIGGRTMTTHPLSMLPDPRHAEPTAGATPDQTPPQAKQ